MLKKLEIAAVNLDRSKFPDMNTFESSDSYKSFNCLTCKNPDQLRLN